MSQLMLNPEEIAIQQERLEAHRGRLAVLLRQVAKLGAAHAPPGVLTGIEEARRDIARIKAILRANGVSVDDHVDDEEPAAAAVRLLSLPLDTIPDPAPLPPGSRMPLARNPLFVGREADLKQLAATLKGGGTAAIGQIAAATGLGGIGKTLPIYYPYYTIVTV